MGEVYRARDTKLGRDVALKVLPDSLAHDPERLARFEREAHLLAALNHPSIAHIHGFEDSTGTPALVMELVEGPTLADRIAQGPIPLDEALPIAKQIAEALEAAHEQGIIHRDLKPANIKIRPDGTVKVLDFGLAKAFDPAASSGAGATMSPTLSIHATRAGLILGTAAYMAPEQARGKTVDRRADIWAFGCVLFEMLTGRRAFDGDDLSVTLATVLKTEPNWTVLPSSTPTGLHRLLWRCLRKDPKDRLQAMGDARVEISELLSDAQESVAAMPVGPTAPLWPTLIALTVVIVITAMMTGAIVWFATRSKVALVRVSRFEILPAGSSAVTISGGGRDLAITPDGSRLIYVGANGTKLFVRPLDQIAAAPLPGVSAPRDPFVSPDGLWVGFFDANTTLKRVAITGGPAARLATLDGFPRGATWAPDGSIIFATSATTTGLQRIFEAGGEPTILTRPDRSRGESDHLWPEVLPSGQAVLFTITATAGGLDAASIGVLDLRNGRRTVLIRGGSDAHYLASGHLLYAAGNSLQAVGFDVAHLIVVGTPVTVLPRVVIGTYGAAEAMMARDGTLFYASGGAGTGADRTLVWVDRQGHETPIGAPPSTYINPQLSPDGTRIAVQDRGTNIWLWDLTRRSLSRVTDDPAIDLQPIWGRDGHRLFFSSERTGVRNLFSQAVDAIGPAEQLTLSPNMQLVTAITPDGSQLIFTETSPQNGDDVMALETKGRKSTPLVQTPFAERNGIVSPDERWLAYEANDTGQFEIYVRSFPDTTRERWPVSTGGGTRPLWAPNGQELFYFAPDRTLMRVGVASGASWKASTPTKLLEGRYWTGGGVFSGRNYDIAADGQRFLMMKEAENEAAHPPQIVVVEHFDEELKRLVSTK
jgi:serine/threonine-protein kinase